MFQMSVRVGESYLRCPLARTAGAGAWLNARGGYRYDPSVYNDKYRGGSFGSAFRNFLAKYHNWGNKYIVKISEINPHLGMINSSTMTHKMNDSDLTLIPDLGFVRAFSMLFADIMLKKDIGFSLFKRCKNKNCKRVFVATRPKSAYCCPRCGGRESDYKYPRAAKGTKEHDTYKRKRMLQSNKYHRSSKGQQKTNTVPTFNT